MSLTETCKSIELILSDVDGVLTDGRLMFTDQGEEIKTFHARDGLGIKLWQKAGFPFGIVSARATPIVQQRAVELDIDLLRQGIRDKREAVELICMELDLAPEQVCFLGDDLLDLAAMQYVGLPIAPADASDEAKAAARFVTQTAGGQGAVREAITMILKEKGCWDAVVASFRVT